MVHRLSRSFCVLAITSLIVFFTLGFFSVPALTALKDRTMSSEVNISTQSTEHACETISDGQSEPTPLAMSIALNRPNGGETLQAGACYNINWTVAGGTMPYKVTLRYTTDGSGGTQYLIGTVEMVINNGSYTWLVPNAPSTNCFINLTVKDSAPTPESMLDQSVSAFTIQPLGLNIRIVSPNGGENWTAATTEVIQWAVSGGYGTLHAKVEYSIDDGATFSLIQPDVVGTNKTTWMVVDPGTTQYDCRVKVTITDSSPTPQTLGDQSDGPWQIYVPPVPPLSIMVMSPTGGDVWAAGSTQTITWSVSGGKAPYSPAKVEYSLDGISGTYTTLTTSAVGGSYIWNLPLFPVESIDAFIRVTVSDNMSTTANGTNDVPFKVSVPELPSVALNSPNGAEVWGVGKTFDITWAISGGVEPLKATIKYSTKGLTGSTTELVYGLDASVGQWSWNIPDTPSTNCYVWIIVEDSYGGGFRTANDTSDDSFTILKYPDPPTVTIKNPLGGEAWTANYEYPIRWNRTGGQAPFTTMIEYSTDGKATYSLIAASATDTGANSEQKWIVPNVLSSNCYIRITVTDPYVQTVVVESNQFEITNIIPPKLGNIEGNVLDSKGAPISGVTVEIVGKSSLRATTNSAGYFIIKNINVGTYSVKFSKTDYNTLTVPDVPVTADSTTKMDDQTMTQPPPPPPPFWLILIMVIIVLVVVIGLVWGVVSRARSRKEEEEKKPAPVWVAAHQHQHQRHHYEPQPRGSGTLPTSSRRVQEDRREVDTEAELARLEDMKSKGYISDDEYEFSRNRLLKRSEEQSQPQYEPAQPESSYGEYGSGYSTKQTGQYDTTPAPAMKPKPKLKKKVKPKPKPVEPAPEQTFEDTSTQDGLISAPRGTQIDTGAQEAEVSEEDLVTMALERAAARKRGEGPVSVKKTETPERKEMDILALNRLAKLEEQRREGKITDEEYLKKRKEITGD